jgi:phenylalanyl-tRNA synthetase alpha chain
MDGFEDALDAIGRTSSLSTLDALRQEILGKKGRLSEAMRQLATLDPEAKRTRGEALNQFKAQWEKAFTTHKNTLESQALDHRLAQETLDVSLPVATSALSTGRIHPLSQLSQELIHIFEKMGFSLRLGPDIENDFNNFTALNIPSHHPARTSHDTFYLTPSEDGTAPLLLRTHTSTVQIRTLLQEKPPLRIIAPGRVFRADYDATHTPMFHQLEGLVIEPGLHMGHLKGCLEEFFRLFFGRPVPFRLRPSFFPFTEPSAEVDILCDRQGTQLKIGEGNDWLEVLGCGMVHPEVLRHCDLDPALHQGFAFGMGVERLAMLKYGITDLRRFFENDTRWLAHYGFKLTD